MTMTLVQTVTVGAGGAASITFSSIPQTGTDLLVLFALRTSYANLSGITIWTFNGGGGSYSYRRLRGTGSAVDNLSGSEQFPALVNGNNATSSTFGNGSLYISNYTSSVAKAVSIDAVSEHNGSIAYQTLLAGAWSGTSAITSISVADSFGGNWQQYSTASLYTISTTGATGATVS